ncbi:hypothetical protein Poli38472_013726 [Pythium oligandrum]|uniref:Uncharacterized protein n=1 Tax=Pythium oligandrum TaxID=41045 RepID=A0A8K1CDZ5_PYTOL|nr:hypothetical protein Poli38472_013726 [Pythium oligandrum]|eukprot:TMW61263.1 hypothetical protein Poli38472_013726 [Pythium oligandrum]
MFEATRAALLAMSGQKKEEFEKRAIPVTLSVDFYDELDIVSTLEHVVELHHRYLTGIDQDQRGLYPLAVNKLKVDIKHWMGSAVLVDVVERCNTTRGLQLDRIAIGPTTRLVVHSDIRSLIWRWATMFTGLPVNRSVCASNQAHVQLSGSKQLDLWLASNVTTAAFLSGVMYSNGVRELILRRSLTVHPSVSEFRWFWLFYSLFNAEATHELTSLSIDDDTIRLADMVKVREFVCSPRPLELLLDSRYDESFAEAARLPSSSTRPAQVVLRRHAPIHLDPTQRLKPLTVDAEDTKFDVMHSLADSYDILVPGYGQCWVNFDDVVAEIPLCQENERCRWKLKTHSITKLSINLADLESDADDRGLPLLLELIGSPITHLSLGFDSDNLRDQSILDAALTHCPSLVSLSLYRVQFDSLDHVFEAYANGQCRVSDLSLDFLALHQPSSIFQLVNLLADPTTTMANTLRQLSLTLDGETPITNEMLEAFAVMLKTNERLRFLTLSVSADQLSRFPPIFSCFNGQHVRSGLPLSARCKRAFLSVVKHAQDIPDVDDSDDAITLSRAVGQLDSLVLTTIFRLAGNVEVRSIVLKAFR